MLIGIRSANYGSSALLIEGDKVQKIGTKFGYTSWHPSGRIAAFSVNKVRQLFHSAAIEVRDVMDFDSLMAYYNVESKTVKTTPILAKKDRLETYPTWSPDGRYLYFCSAPLTWSDREVIPESSTSGARWNRSFQPRIRASASFCRESARMAAGCCSACAITAVSRFIGTAAIYI